MRNAPLFFAHFDVKQCRFSFQQSHSCDSSPVLCTVAFQSRVYSQFASGFGGGFSNNLRETLTYNELLKHEFYSILRNYG